MFTPSKYQQAYFDWIVEDQGSAIVEAVAGSGKTTTLLEGLRRMSGKAVYFAFNKKIVDETKAKILELGIPNGEAQTLHSYGYSTLRYGRKGNALKPDAKKIQRIVDAWAVEDDAAKDERDFIVETFGAFIRSTVSLAKNRGIGALCDMRDMDEWMAMISHFDLDMSLPEEMPNGWDLNRAINMCIFFLVRSNKRLDIIDFDDMLYMPLLFNLRGFQFDWVLIDEAQDTNPTRRELARLALKPRGRLVAVGDPSQAIYGFTGADNDALDVIAREFNCKRLPLTVSYRCPRAVVAHAQQIVSHIESFDGAQEGSVSFATYDEALKVYAPRDAILCRKNAPLVTLCFKLIRDGKAARIEGRDVAATIVAMVKRFKCRTVDELEEKLIDWSSSEIEKLLAKKEEDKADRVADQVETIKTLINRTRDTSGSTVEELLVIIESIFVDDAKAKGFIVLCSVHKSKGLEWDNVFILGRNAYMPSPWARQEWQQAQEQNLIYVAITRAKKNLVEVSVPVEKKDE